MRGTPKNSEVMVWKFLSLRSVILIASALILASLTAQANLLDPPVKKMTIELTEGTNMMVAPSPDGETIILALQGTLWSMPSSGGEATRLTGWDFEATWPVWSASNADPLMSF